VRKRSLLSKADTNTARNADFINGIGYKRTSLILAGMSAFRPRADIADAMLDANQACVSS
jgi:hypothetical protein